MNSLRMFRDFALLQRWEREILKRDDHSEGFALRTFRMIPWSGVAMFFFVMVFFGVDLGAGIKYTASQIKDQKNEAVINAEMKKAQSRQWSREQVKNFQEGEMPKPSWAEGGPREHADKKIV